MEVILLEHVEKLGKMGDKVSVKNGYARNYLLPQRKALRATEANVAYFEAQRASLGLSFSSVLCTQFAVNSDLFHFVKLSFFFCTNQA